MSAGVNGSSKIGTNGRSLSPAFVAHQFRKGTSGNPNGFRGSAYAECLQIARRLAPRAVERLGELMESDDERVAAIAAGAVLDRAIGRPRDRDDQTDADGGEQREAARRELFEMLEQHARLIRENAELKQRLSAE